MTDPTAQLFTVRQFCERHPWPSQHGLRWLIFNAQDNGFGKCVVRIGRRVLIDESAFFKWTETYRDAPPSRAH